MYYLAALRPTLGSFLGEQRIFYTVLQCDEAIYNKKWTWKMLPEIYEFYC